MRGHEQAPGRVRDDDPGGRRRSVLPDQLGQLLQRHVHADDALQEAIGVVDRNGIGESRHGGGEKPVGIGRPGRCRLGGSKPVPETLAGVIDFLLPSCPRHPAPLLQPEAQGILGCLEKEEVPFPIPSYDTGGITVPAAQDEIRDDGPLLQEGDDALEAPRSVQAALFPGPPGAEGVPGHFSPPELAGDDLLHLHQGILGAGTALGFHRVDEPPPPEAEDGQAAQCGKQDGFPEHHALEPGHSSLPLRKKSPPHRGSDPCRRRRWGICRA